MCVVCGLVVGGWDAVRFRDLTGGWQEFCYEPVQAVSYAGVRFVVAVFVFVCVCVCVCVCVFAFRQCYPFKQPHTPPLLVYSRTSILTCTTMPLP